MQIIEKTLYESKPHALRWKYEFKAFKGNRYNLHRKIKYIIKFDSYIRKIDDIFVRNSVHR